MNRHVLRLVFLVLPLLAIAHTHTAPPLPRLLSSIAEADFSHCSLSQLPAKVRQHLKGEIEIAPNMVQYGFELCKRDINRDGQRELLVQTPFGGQGGANYEIFLTSGTELIWLGTISGFAPIGLREYKNGFYQLSTHAKTGVASTFLNLFAFNGSRYCLERSDEYYQERFVRTASYDLNDCK